MTFSTLTLRMEARKAAQANPAWRYGQAVYNTAARMWPDLTRRLRAGPHDCFYDDRNIAGFIAELQRLAAEGEK